MITHFIELGRSKEVDFTRETHKTERKRGVAADLCDMKKISIESIHGEWLGHSNPSVLTICSSYPARVTIL